MRALIIVDLQNDFVPGGALPVPGGNEIAALANRLQLSFDLIVATQDWHPANHGSFAANHAGRQPGDVIELAGLPQILWPVHCVQNTPGAALVAELDTSRVDRIFYKGTDPAIDSYSGFFDNAHRRATGLADYLAQKRVRDVYTLGLATDYCVKFTAIDSQQLGFKTHVVVDACRGVNLKPTDTRDAIRQMGDAGVQVVESTSLLVQQ
jgi:nicotinamidase/pyrazinamidase